MKPKIQALLEVLDELVAILELHGDQHWSQWIRDDASELRRGNLGGVRHFLTAYGGMGSLNDRYLCTQNGDRITEAETVSINARLSQARSKAWSLARAVLNSEGAA
jgi:hypothetical protein